MDLNEDEMIFDAACYGRMLTYCWLPGSFSSPFTVKEVNALAMSVFNIHQQCHPLRKLDFVGFSKPMCFSHDLYTQTQDLFYEYLSADHEMSLPDRRQAIYLMLENLKLDIQQCQKDQRLNNIKILMMEKQSNDKALDFFTDILRDLAKYCISNASFHLHASGAYSKPEKTPVRKIM